VSYLSAGLLAAAAVSLGRAIQINNGFYDERALVWLSIAFVCLLAALVPGRSAAGAQRRFRLLAVTVMTAGLAGQYATLLTAKPAMYIRFQHPADEPLFFQLLIAATAASVGVVAGRRRVRRTAFLAVLLLHIALGAWMLRASPNPRIDVVTVHRQALNALNHGESPYSITFANIYGDQSFYAPGLASKSRVLFGLPYPPLSLLLAWPGERFAGDYRIGLLFALTAAGGLLGFLGWRARGPDAVLHERQACLAALLLLFTPRVFFQLEQGWTEPFAVGLLALAVLTGRTRAQAPVTGLLLAVKQYLVLGLPLLPLLWPGTSFWRRIAIACATAAIVTVPFLIWDPRGFVNSVVLLQFAEPFRADSLSYLVWMTRMGMWAPHLWITLTAALVAAALALWRLPRTPAGFAAGIALVSMASFAFGKKAFCNYYFFVIAALSVAVAAAGERGGRDAAGEESLS
jgi:hypothetical protein